MKQLLIWFRVLNGLVINTENTIAMLFHTRQIKSFLKPKVVFEGKGKGKSVPLQGWSSPEGSRKLRFPDFMTMAQEGSRIVSPTHWSQYS